MQRYMDNWVKIISRVRVYKPTPNFTEISTDISQSSGEALLSLFFFGVKTSLHYGSNLHKSPQNLTTGLRWSIIISLSLTTQVLSYLVAYKISIPKHQYFKCLQLLSCFHMLNVQTKICKLHISWPQKLIWMLPKNHRFCYENYIRP